MIIKKPAKKLIIPDIFIDPQDIIHLKKLRV